MTDSQKQSLQAVADFIDYLGDHGFVVAKNYHGDWIPISPEEGEQIALRFVAESFGW